jgi:hypothetical protein
MSTNLPPLTVGADFWNPPTDLRGWAADITYLGDQPFQFFAPIQIGSINLTPIVPGFLMAFQEVKLAVARHGELLEEIYEMVKVIEVETRRLNPDAIHDMTDAAESGLNDILRTIQERRFPPPPSQEIDALLSQAIEKKRSLTPAGELTPR